MREKLKRINQDYSRGGSMARMLTETTDFEPTFSDIEKHVSLGDLSSAVYSVLDDDEELNLFSELARCLAACHMPRFKAALVNYYRDCERLERAVIESERLKTELITHD